MRQVLFEIPGLGVKVFGYGLMLFLAFLGSMNLAAWRARREKLDPEIVYDLALCVFLGGLIGARALLRRPVLGRPGPHASGRSSRSGRAGSSSTGASSAGRSPSSLYRRAPAVPAPADARRDRPGAGPRDRDRPVRLLPQRLLLRRRLRPPLGRHASPKHSPPWEAEVARDLIAARRRPLAPAPPDPALFDDRRPDPARSCSRPTSRSAGATAR